MEKAVFWDWNGTLADESRLDASVCRSMEEGIAAGEKISLKEAEKRFRNYLKKLENTWVWHDYVHLSRYFSLDWEDIQRKHLFRLRILPGAEEAVQDASKKGYINILATNAVRRVILLRLQQAGLSDAFDFVITGNDVQGLKSSGKHYKRGLKLSAADPEMSFSVGDNPLQDIIAAQRFGIRTVYCQFSGKLTHHHSLHIFGEHTENFKPDYVIGSLKELPEIF